MEGVKEKEHLLALKVMRLTKPSLMISHALPTCSPRDLPYDAFHEFAKSDLMLNPGLPQFSIGSFLTLPQNFGNIFLGETFSSYISIHNDSQQTCGDIVIKADLQTSSQRLTLSGANTAPKSELDPDDSIDDVIHHEVKELGTHILVCAVSYTTASKEKMYFRKFFKFHVLKPLDVKTKFYNTESDDVYLEAQIQNITPGPIYLEKVALEPSLLYNVKELNSQPSTDSGLGLFGSVNYVNTMDVRQYLYCFVARPEASEDVRLLKGVTNIGKLDIVWKTNMGEKGRLQTSQLQRVAPGCGDIKVTVDDIPQMVTIGETFNLHIKVTNCCERPMELMLSLQNGINTGLLWSGLSGRQLCRVEPCVSITLNLSMTAISTGLMSISGLRLTDTFLKRTYEHDDIAQVYVYAPDIESPA